MQEPVTYRDLEVWQRAMDLAETLYRETAGFPRAETLGLAGQIRRAAVSIPLNIAEGRTKRSTKSFAFHVNVCRGSVAELETCLALSVRVGLLPRTVFETLSPQLTSLGQMLAKLHRTLRDKLDTRQAV